MVALLCYNLDPIFAGLAISCEVTGDLTMGKIKTISCLHLTDF